MKIKKYFPFLKSFSINPYRVVHGLKTALACFIGLGIEKYYKLPAGEWIPLTIMMVMSAQTHFGGAVHKAFMRFIGSLLGIFISITVLWFFDGHIIAIFSMAFIASVIFAYIASSHGDISSAGTLGAVTVLVILTTGNGSIDMALHRGYCIVAGIIIALLVSRFVYPIYAGDRYRYHVAYTLRKLSEFYLLAINSADDSGWEDEKEQEKQSIKMNLKIINDIVNQSKLIHEAIVGSRDFAIKRKTYHEILNSEHSLNRLINLMFINIRESLASVDVKKQLESVENLHNIIRGGLEDLADCFESVGCPGVVIDFNKALQKVAYALEKMPKLEGAHQVIVGHSFLFVMEQIIKELEKLKKLIVKVNSKSEDSVV